jgi:signal transduction histidine kinase
VAPAPDAAPLTLCAAADVTTEVRALTALREMRQRSEDLISLISDCVWETDAEWRLTHFAARGAAPETGRVFVGRSLFEVGAAEAGQPGETGRPARPLTPRMRAIFRDAPFRIVIDGAVRLFLLTGMPVFDDDTGAFRGYRGSGDDVTARRLAESNAEEARAALLRTLEALEARNAELDAALTAAKAADAAKDEFLARMSHELRTPLNAVMGLSSIVKFSVAEQIDDKYVGYLDEIHRSGEHLLALVSEVLEFSRNRLTDRPLDREALDLTEVARESAAMLRVAAAERGVALSVDAAPGMAVMGDRTRLRQVFVNLIGNAVKFTDGGGAVRVAVFAEGGAVRVDVRDEGVGIPADKLDKVFEPFFQVDGGPTRANGGVGLGLALSRQLVERHGGAIAIDSVEGAGTTVRVTLPAAGG